MALEIRIADETQVVDLVPQGLYAGMKIFEAVAKAVENWVASGMKDPLTITLTPQESTGPPMALGISVGDETKVGAIARGG